MEMIAKQSILLSDMLDYFSLTIFLCFCIPFLSAQNIPDSLLQKSKDMLILGYNKTDVFEEKEAYGKALIAVAKRQKDTLYMVTGNHIMAVLYNDKKALMYCDSIITLTQKSPNVLYPATAHLIKGSLYYTKRDFKNALDNFILANTYAKDYNNISLIYKSNYAIGILKNRIGENEEALQLHRKNYAYLKDHLQTISKTDYLNAIFALADTFNDMGILDSAAYYNRYGAGEALRLNNHRKYQHFILNSGVTSYYQKNYQIALDSIRKSLPYFEGVNDKPNMAVGYYYLGKLYFEFDQENNAVFYLKKVDTVFQKNKDVLPKLRESYLLLKEYYKEKNDAEMQLHYVEQLIRLDSILHSNELYLNKNIIKEYDIPRLIAEKETIISTLTQKESRARLVIIIVLGVLIVTVLLSYYQYRKKVVYKQQAEALTREQQIQLKRIKKSDHKKGSIGISEEIVNNILIRLDTFENNRGYLDPDISIHNLAKKIQTNPNYLSKVINHYKNMSFIHYINQLRIRHAIYVLKTSAIYRKFTIKALAGEFGFNTSESFSSAFYKHTGTKPSYFIRELNNS